MAEAEVGFARRGRAGIITLNRPKALNALTRAMVREMHRALVGWAGDPAVGLVIIEGAGERAFCAGGDIRELYELGRAQDAAFLAFYAEEYRLNTLIKRYPKPYVALIDGIVMGGGVGVSIHGSQRVASERITFAMPETGIGLFPDVGGSWFLPRCPGETGMYLALAGARLKAADTLYCGLATHHVPAQQFAALKAALCEEGAPEATIARFAADPGAAPLEARRGAIDRCFAAGSVEEILARLDGERGADADWARQTAATIRAKSPTSLKITYCEVREGARLSFEACMRLEYRMVNGIFRGHDFFEGTRATVIDKDGAPRWRPASLDEVSEADVAAYFAPPADGDLDLG